MNDQRPREIVAAALANWKVGSPMEDGADAVLAALHEAGLVLIDLDALTPAHRGMVLHVIRDDGGDDVPVEVSS